ncbi:MAG: restriction endonuclease subunit S [Elusimicrobia bacterium]|nr:restriction endonuclease subunit S [Elusimicrobiota bacterium]
MRLGELSKIQTGKLDVNAEDKNGIYPFFTCAREPTYINTHAFDCECVLVAGNGDLNVKYYNGKFNAYQRTYVVEVIKKDKLDVYFLYYLLNKQLENLRRLSIGGVIKYIKLGNLTNILVPDLSLDQQKKIVHILQKAESAIEKRKQANKLTDKFLKSAFLEMFGDPVKRLNNIKKLIEVCELNPKLKVNIPDDKKVSFVPMSAVSITGKVDISQTRRYEEVKIGFTYFQERDVLFAKITPCMENGKGGIAKDLKNGIGFGSTEFHVLRPLKESVSEWIYFLLSFKHIREIAARNMTGTAGQKRVPASFLKNLKVSVPSLEKQQKFADLVQKVEKLKQKQKESEKELNNLFNSLMQKAFRGGLQ